MKMEGSTEGRRRGVVKLLLLTSAAACCSVAFAMAVGQSATTIASAVADEADDAAPTTGTLDDAWEAYRATTPQESGTCIVCHSSMELLEASASDPDGDLAMYLVDEAFVTTTHGALGCTYCHGGHADQADASAAMAFMNARPTVDGGKSVCGNCHADVVETFAVSLHSTQAGVRNAWVNRMAIVDEKYNVNFAEDYFYHDGYEGQCVDCHATCGECHVIGAEEPLDPVYGLIDGHNFVDGTTVESEQTTCLVCHDVAITRAYTGHDVHGPTGANMACMDCHSVDEIHGDGTAYATMIGSGAIKAECIDCHDRGSLEGQWHSETHLDGATCFACHTVEYRTCENCHGWFAGTRGDEPKVEHYDCYLGYAVGTDEITTLVKGPVDAKMLGDVTSMEFADEDFATGSTWYAGFAHGVIVPELDQEFCDRCHGEGTDLLKEGDLQYPDYEREQLVTGLPEVNIEDYPG